MSVPNVKRIAPFVQKLLGCPKISNLGHVTLSHAHFWVIYDPDAVGARPLYLRQIWSIYLHSFKSYKGGPKISKFGHVTQATPT